MQEVEFAWSVWRLVEAILEFGMPSEIMRRMMVSRLYYAAYHVALLLLRNAGWTPRVETGAHRQVQHQLRRRYVNTQQMRGAALDSFRNLFQMRVDADYHLNVRVRERTVRHAMRLFMTFFDEARRILGVP